MKPRRILSAARLSFPLATALAALVTAPSARAASDSWNVDANGNWTTFGSWLSGTQAPGSDTLDNTEIATFSNTLTAARTVTVDATRFIGGISFGNTSAFGFTLGGGSLILNSGGVIQTLADNGNHTDLISSPITISGISGATAAFTANATSSTSLLSIGAVIGSATTGNTTTLTLNGTNTGLNTVTGIIGDGSGGGKLAITKADAGTWRLSGQNTFTGDVNITGGTLVAGVSAAGNTQANPALGTALGLSNTSRTITVGSSGTLNFSAANVLTTNFAQEVSFLPDLVVAGTLTNSATSNNALGNVTLNGGTITGTSGHLTYGAFNLNGTITSTGTSTISASGNARMMLNSSGANNVDTATSFNVSDTLTVSATLADLRVAESKMGGINKSGTGTLILSAANTFTGSTTVSAGNLSLSNALALQNSALVTTGAGTVTLSGVTTPTFGGLSGASGDLASVITNYNTVTALTLNPSVVTDSFTYGGVIGNGSGNTSLTKTGAGTQILNGAAVHTFTGGLNINRGNLNLDYTNLATPTNLVDATNALQINNGTLAITGKNVAAATTSQTFASTTLGAGVNTISINKGASATSATLDLKALTISPGSVNIFNTGTVWASPGVPTAEIVKISSYNGTALPGSGSVYVNAGLFFRSSALAGSARYVSVNSSGQLQGQIAASAVLTATTNAATAVHQISTGNITFTTTTANSYALIPNASAPGRTLTLAANGTYTLNGIVQAQAANGLTINAGTGTSNIIIGSERNLMINMDNSAPLVINAPIVNTTLGVSPFTSAVTIASTAPSGTTPGLVTFGGANTFTGQLRVVNSTLSIATINNASASGALGNSALSVILGGSAGQTGTLSYSGNTASSTKAFTMATGGTGAFDVSTSGQTLTLTGNIDGGGGLTKTGAGVLILSGANTYSGDTTQGAGGELRGAVVGTSLTPTSPFGTSTIRLSGFLGVRASGTLSTTAQTVTIGNNVVVSGNSTIDVNRPGATSTNKTMAMGTLTIGGNTLSVTNGQSYRLSFGETTLTGNATFNPSTDATTELTLGAVGQSGGPRNLTKSGAGILTLNGAGTYTGSTTVNAGTLRLGNANALGGTSSLVMAGGTTLSPTVTGVVVSAPITVGTTGTTVTINAPSVGSQDLSAGVLTLDGAIGGAGNVTFNSSQNVNNLNNVLLTAQSNYAGSTLITTSGGTASQIVVRLGIDNALPITTVVTIDGAAGTTSGRIAELNLFGFNQSLAGLTNIERASRPQRVVNSDSVAASTLTINGPTDTTFTGLLGSDSANFSVSDTAMPGSTNGNNFGLTKDGTGTFTLSPTTLVTSNGTTYSGNTYAGATKILGGVLSLGSSTAMQNSPLDTLNSVSGNGTQGLRSTVTTLTMGGLTGDKNFADVFTTATGGPANVTARGGYDGLTALTLNPVTGATHSYSGNIGDGATGLTLTKTGAGTQILTGTNSYTGLTTINAGTLAVGGGTAVADTGSVSIATVAGATFQLNNNETIGSLSGGGLTGGAVNLQANTLTVGDATNTTFAGVVGGSGGGLTKQGTGALTLTNTNVYTGLTTISGGTLALSGIGEINTNSGITINGSGAKLLQNSSVAISPVVTLTQGTLTGNGTVNTVNVGAGTGGIVSNNDGVAGLPLTIGTLAFNGAAAVNTFNATTSAAIVTTSLSTNLAGSVTINPSGTWTSGAAHDLISFGGGSIGVAGGGQFVLGMVSGLSARQAIGIFDTTDTTAIKLTIDGDTPIWSGLGAATWTTAVTNDNTGPNDWALKTGNTGTNFWATDGVEFNDTYNIGGGPVAVTNTTVTITGGVAPSATIFNNSAVNYTLTTSDATGITSGILTKNGSGTVTINNANTYTGGTILNAGALEIGNASALGTSGTLTLAGGTLKYGTGITQDLSGRFNTAASQAYKIDTNGNAVTFATALTSVGGALTKEGANTLTLTATNTYTGTTAINGGTLQLGDGGTTGALTGTTGITSSGTATLAINRSNAFTQATDLNGQAITGANLSVTKPGAGDLTLSGNNSYGGATIVNAGNLFITHNNALGSTVGSTTINGGNGTTGQSLSLTNATSDLVIAENLNFLGNTAGRAQLVNNTTFNHEFTGAIDVSSDTNLTQFNSGSTGSFTISGDISGTMANGAVLFLRGVSTSALNRVTGSLNLTGGDLAKTDAGTWLVGASGETYSWANTLLANGRLNMGAANVLPSTGVLTMGEGGARTPTLDLNGFSQTTAGITYGAAGGTPTGTRTITNSDAVNAAVFTINNATDNTSGLTGTNTVVLTGNLGLTKQGAGKLTLLGTNTYTGNTIISGGTLEMASNLIASSANIFIGNGATLSGTGGFTLAANRNVTGTGATGNLTTSSATGLITAGGNTISNSVALGAGTLTLTRLDVRGTGNQITEGDIQSGGTGSNQRGLLVGNVAGTSDLTITGGTLTSNGGNNSGRYDVIGNSNITGSIATLTIDGGNYVNMGGGRTTLGNASNLAATATITLTNGSATINELEYVMGSFAGNTATVNLDGGTLTVSKIISTSGTNKIFNFNGGQFVAGGAAFSIGSGLTLNVKDGGAKIDTNGNSFTIADALLNAGAGGLTKSGEGNLTLQGTNTYTGATTVTAGVLTVSSTGSLAAGSTVSVADTATLGVAGTIHGAVTVASGGTLAGNGGTFNSTVAINGIHSPGASPGLQTFTNGLAYGSAAILNVDLVGDTLGLRGTDYDGVDVTGGNLSIDSLASLSLTASGIDYTAALWDATRDFTVIAYSGGGTSSGFFALNTTNAGTFAPEGSWSLANTSNNIVLSWTPVPEPGTAALGLLGTALLLRRRRR